MQNNIKQIIKSKGIKQIYICKELGINESVLSLIINGKRKPSQDRLKALARILNVSIKDLYPDVKIKRINYYYI
jgi:transcriptional regulator with XRE-family HTH domain